jgi:hypothetical protein
VSVGIVENHLVGPYIFPGVWIKRKFAGITRGKFSRNSTRNVVDSAPSYYVQNATQEIPENRYILNWVPVSWTRRAESMYVLQTMTAILSNFFDVSFYAFSHNYSLFTLLFKPL